MANQHLTTYLNDHLAGAMAAVEILGQLTAKQAGTAVGASLAELRADVLTDRQELEALMARLQIAQSRPRMAMGWLSEKLAQVKLQLDDPADGALRLLEALEALVIGIEGKRALWQALAAAAQEQPELQGADYARLIQRAKDQHRRAEELRLEAARAAFRATP
jgi:hypothetical protein